MNLLARIGQSAPELKALTRLAPVTTPFLRTNQGQGYFGNMAQFDSNYNVIGRQNDFDLEALAGEPLHNGVIAACVDAICKALADAPLLLENRTKDGWKAVDDHECLVPLHRPNEDHSDADIWGLTAGYKATRGQAFWLLLPNRGGTVGEIHVWRPELVTVLGDETNFISGYRVQKESGGYIENLPKEQVIHFRHLPDFRNGRVGWNPLSAGRAQLAGDNISGVYHTSILNSAGVVSLLVTMKEGVINGQVTSDQFQQVLTNIRRATKERAGGVEGLNVPLDVHKLAYSPDEMGVTQLIAYYELRLCSLMGVSPRVAKLGVDPTYNNLAEALQDFWERRMVPDRNSDAATLNRQYLPLWGLDDGNWRFRFDYSNVAALQENKDELHTRVGNDYKNGAFDLKQYRVLAGYAGTDEAYEAQFEGVFYAPPKSAALPGQGGDDGKGDVPEVKTVDANGISHSEENGRFDGGQGGGSFDSAHKWTGDELPEKESPQFQDGKAKALEDLLPYTRPGSLEAATVVLKKDGSRFGKLATGNRDEVSVAAPMNVPVALLHTHDYDGPHSEGDWGSFLINKGQEQSHVVTATKTYSLHKPDGWSAADHGLAELGPGDSQGAYDDKAEAAEQAYLDVWKDELSKFKAKPGFPNSVNLQDVHRAAGKKMAEKTGIIYREGDR